MHLEEDGKQVDRKGDKLANGGEYNRRHNATLRAGTDMVRAGAVGAIVLGDKEKPELTNMLNNGHVLDFAELDGDPDSGGDVIYEVKVPSPLKKKYSEGRGSAAGGQPATMGHVHGFGSTFEEYSKLTYGLKQRGSPRDRPFDHKSGKGYVAPHKGHYHDALYVKKLRVVMLLIEALGGIAPPARAHIAKLARRSEGRGATDRTKYGGTRISTKSFYVHHSQMMVKAAVMHDAKAILKQVTCLKQRVCTAANAADGRAHA